MAEELHPLECVAGLLLVSIEGNRGEWVPALVLKPAGAWQRGHRGPLALAGHRAGPSPAAYLFEPMAWGPPPPPSEPMGRPALLRLQPEFEAAIRTC